MFLQRGGSVIKDIIFLLKQNYLFFSKRGVSQLLLWIILIVIIILIGTVFVANQNNLIGKNVDGLTDYTGSLFGSTNG